jgi:SAM-dependent methyltransferase
MQRADWLKQMRAQAEALYDRLSPQYWVSFGFYADETHQEYLQKFLQQITPAGSILSAGCGAGRYDGLLLEAGHRVVGTDQSLGMLRRAIEMYPSVLYLKLGLQELDFQAAFDGVTCIDALEHVPPEDWPGILQNFWAALKPGGMLYFTLDLADPADLESALMRSLGQNLPVVYGEVVDQVNETYEQVMALEPDKISGELSDQAVYHYYPGQPQVRVWLEEAGLNLEAEGVGDGYAHFLAKKRRS